MLCGSFWVLAAAVMAVQKAALSNEKSFFSSKSICKKAA
jgi:hypothetical protein